tara:strand:+ start:195 stop:560 length:366 start_codon:yes stop_codon:yes gene_type:complete
MVKDTSTFLLNDRVVRSTDPMGMVLADVVRDPYLLKGTKIACREGDCGACTMLVGELQSDGQVAYHSITSCISPVVNAHGKHIVTIDGITSNYHFFQGYFKEFGAAQCGYCNPGFMVSFVA